MFGLDPLSRPVAIAEIVLLLSLAAFIGWFIARLILNARVSGLRADIAERERELANCRQSRVATLAVPSIAVASGSVASATTMAPAMTQTVVISPPFVEETPVQAYVAPIPASPVKLPIVDERPAPLMAQGSEAAVLSRIALRASELNFDRIGRATAADADDLKDIVGIGPFLERKLHSLGIYTFRQVANFAKEDIDKVNEIIEFFPGRIERDNWVGQSKLFDEKKRGN